MSVSDGSVSIHVKDKIGIITFGHPKGNSLPGKLLKKIADKLNAFSADEDVDAIFIQSEGEKAFCAGASFEELLKVKTFEDGKRFFSGFADVIIAQLNSPKIIVTRVHGKVVGGGVGIVAASDYVLANKQAGLRLSELELGIGPFVIGPALERKIGKAHYATLAFGTKWMNAQWGQDCGLYNELFPNINELDIGVKNYIKKLRGFNPKAVSELKKTLIDKSFEKTIREQVALTAKFCCEEFTQEKIQALVKNP